jgi:hypothetical protein
VNYELLALIAVVVIGGLMAIGASGKRAELERRLTLTERKLAQVVQKLAANGVEGMADLWQQPLPLITNQPQPESKLKHRNQPSQPSQFNQFGQPGQPNQFGQPGQPGQPNQFGPLTNDPIAKAEMGFAMDEVQSLIMQGKKIQAIKVYRELTGVGLKEAKDAVEQMAGER